MSDEVPDIEECDLDPTAVEELTDLDDEVTLEEIFHRLSRLLPDAQELLWFDASTLASDALTVLQRSGFSQAPVRQGTRYRGVFSYRSFARAVTVVGSPGSKVSGLTV